MFRVLSYFMQGLLAAALLTACSNNTAPRNAAPAGDTVSALDVSCATVLVPLAVSDTAPLGSIDGSIARYQQAVFGASQPLHHLERLGWAFVAKARSSRDAGFYVLAEQTAACMEHSVPGAPEALLLRGHVLHNLHRFSEAEVLARRLVAQRGLWFDFALLGDVLMERGVLNEAVDAYQAVIDQRPGPQAYARVAQLRWFKGDVDGAVEMMANAVRTTSARTPEPAAWAHVQLALLLMQVDDLSAADTVLERALALQAEYAPALHARGRLLLAQHRSAAAIVVLERAVQANPMPQYRWTLYEALLAAGRDSAAVAQKAALLQRGEAEDRRTVALFLATLGDESDTALRLALRELEQRKDVFTLDALAWALSAAGRNDEAIDYSRRALAEGTQDARLYFHAGVIAARAGDSAQASELLSKADAVQQMLLPSERQQLNEIFAALRPQLPTPVKGRVPSRDLVVF